MGFYQEFFFFFLFLWDFSRIIWFLCLQVLKSSDLLFKIYVSVLKIMYFSFFFINYRISAPVPTYFHLSHILHPESCPTDPCSEAPLPPRRREMPALMMSPGDGEDIWVGQSRAASGCNGFVSTCRQISVDLGVSHSFYKLQLSCFSLFNRDSRCHTWQVKYMVLFLLNKSWNVNVMDILFKYFFLFLDFVPISNLLTLFNLINLFWRQWKPNKPPPTRINSFVSFSLQKVALIR